MMKHTSTPLRCAALMGLMAPGALFAGSGKDVPAPPAPPEMPESSGGLYDELGASLSVGYDTDYVFRGLELSEHLVWGGIDVAVPLAEQLSLDLGAWYATSADDSGIIGDGSLSELDLFATLNYAVTDNLTLSAGYIRYMFDGDFADETDDVNEYWAGVAYSIYGASVSLAAYYDDVAEGFYFETGVDYGIALTEAVTLTPAVVVSYADDYYGFDGFHHVGPRLTLDVALTDSATLSPYVAGNIPLGDLDDSGADDLLYGGVALSVSF